MAGESLATCQLDDGWVCYGCGETFDGIAPWGMYCPAPLCREAYTAEFGEPKEGKLMKWERVDYRTVQSNDGRFEIRKYAETRESFQHWLVWDNTDYVRNDFGDVIPFRSNAEAKAWCERMAREG